MKRLTCLWAIGVATALFLTGCDQLPGAGPDVLIVDLSTVAKATGQEEAMQQQAQTSREELNVKLSEIVRNLEQQLADERSRFGDTPTEEQQQQLQQMTMGAQQQYSQLQADAQQQAQQYEINLVLEFRERVMPFAEKIARARGAHVVMLGDQSVFWLDPAVNITEDIIAALSADGVFVEPDAEPAAEPVAKPAAAPETGAVAE